MLGFRYLAVLIIGLIFVGGALFGLNFSNAQQMPPATNNQKSVSPSPTVSPTPEIIEEDDEVIKIDTEAVNVLFTAQDRNRRLLTDLKQTDVRIVENGQPQEITAFARQVDLPLSLAILIDTSASQERTLPEEKSAAKAFLQSVIRPAKDEVSIVSFTGETTLEQGMTNNLTRLARAVDKVEFVPPSGYVGGGVVVPGTPPISGDNQMAQGSTAIWDAIWVTSEEVLKSSPDKTRRAIILLSDGVNTFGSKKFDDAVQAALRSEAVIYSIGVGDEFYGGVDEGAMKKISERTGGRAFFPRDESELRKAFTQIQIELRSQYLIAYEPSNQKRDGSFRKIEIQLTNPELSKQKVKLTHRQGYFAKTDSGQKPMK
ncbi:MAG: VWA domain-containing protein [Acidobacteria bacterium]|jgi:VWFA-related protein|nr:VWA domain-containing protein [Acidobacteriota bacterium]MBA4122594.1 VWA domain-containing protein [Acidobacteriota bacterium]MBA4185556.1 VWA domain-containing protein [Acidobacteriota bacterium]